MAAKTHGEGGDRLEKVAQILAEDQLSLQKLIGELAVETRRGFDSVSEQFKETDRRIAERSLETDRRFRETDERFRETGERIDRLVSGIGEFIRRSDR